MAYVNLSPGLLIFPGRAQGALYFDAAGANWMGILEATTLSTSGDVMHQIGQILWADQGTNKTISKIHFPLGAVTFNGGVSALQLGLQTVDNLAPHRGDGTFDVYGTLTALTANAVNFVTISSGTQTYSHRELVDFVIQYSTFTTGDSIEVLAIDSSSAAQLPAVLKNTSVLSLVPNIILEDSEGTVGILAAGSFISNAEQILWNSGSTPNEYGNIFRVPFNCKVIGVHMMHRFTNASGAGTINLYSDPTGTPSSMVSKSFSLAEFGTSTATQRGGVLLFDSEVTLTKDTDYCIAVAPSNTNNHEMIKLSLGTAGFAAAMSGGTTVKQASRSSGAFSTDTSAYLPINIVISQIDDGAGGSTSGMIVHPGMSGGMRA